MRDIETKLGQPRGLLKVILLQLFEKADAAENAVSEQLSQQVAQNVDVAIDFRAGYTVMAHIIKTMQLCNFNDEEKIALLSKHFTAEHLIKAVESGLISAPKQSKLDKLITLKQQLVKEIAAYKATEENPGQMRVSSYTNIIPFIDACLSRTNIDVAYKVIVAEIKAHIKQNKDDHAKGKLFVIFGSDLVLAYERTLDALQDKFIDNIPANPNFSTRDKTEKPLISAIRAIALVKINQSSDQKHTGVIQVIQTTATTLPISAAGHGGLSTQAQTAAQTSNTPKPKN